MGNVSLCACRCVWLKQLCVCVCERERARERERKERGKTIDKNSIFEAIPHGSARVLSASKTILFFLPLSFYSATSAVSQKGIEIADAQVTRSHNGALVS